jgi:heavy metal sensor kinase
MMDSVRIRLTLWYTAAMALVLVVLAAVTYFVIRQNVVQRADAQASELADTFLSTVEAEIGDAPKADGPSDSVAAALSEHQFRDVVFIVFDGQGNLLGVSQSFGREGSFEHTSVGGLAASLQPLVSKTEFFSSVRLAGRSYRSYTRRFMLNQQGATLIVLQSLKRQREFLETLAGTFAIVIPMAIVLAGFGGYLLARRSLSPVVAMSAEASHIGAENLDARLNVRNPRDELGQLAGSFNELLDRLSRSFEQQRRFVADASHELRTPVAILCGEAEVTLSENKRTEPEYRETLEILRKEANRLKRIVEDLFTLARADAGQHPLALSDFYLDELAAECSHNVRTLAAAKKITLSCESRGEFLVHADETLLRRMVLNLLDNAIKYTPEGGAVSLRCGEQNGSYRLSVQDSGPGVPADLQPRIFERFFRADKARSRGENDSGGAGLGLAIASWIAGAHGGRLELTNSTAQGSLFTVLLPKTTSRD